MSFVYNGMQGKDTIEMVKEEQTESNIIYVSLLSQCCVLYMCCSRHQHYMIICWLFALSIKSVNAFASMHEAFFCQQTCRHICTLCLYNWDISVLDTSWGGLPLATSYYQLFWATPLSKSYLTFLILTCQRLVVICIRQKGLLNGAHSKYSKNIL